MGYNSNQIVGELQEEIVKELSSKQKQIIKNRVEGSDKDGKYKNNTKTKYEDWKKFRRSEDSNKNRISSEKRRKKKCAYITADKKKKLIEIYLYHLGTRQRLKKGTAEEV